MIKKAKLTSCKSPDQKTPSWLRLFQRNSHPLVWMLIWMLFLFNSSRHLEFAGAFVMSTVNILPVILINQLLRKWMIPHLLQKNHRKQFYLFSILMIIILSPIVVQIDNFAFHMLDEYAGLDLQLTHRYQIERESEEGGRVILMAKWLLMLLSATAATIITWLIEEHKRLEQKAHEQHMQSELKYLKSQINPHFLFNSLNCIYALTITNDEKASDSVLKLSEMLRYVIDDCAQDEVPISKEINYIHNYIDFQRIRMEHERDIRFDTQVEDHTFPIPPMIFQPMIENCFKHSRIVDQPNSFVHIELKQKSGLLSFVAENSIPVHAHKLSDDERMGIGLQNVEQRLQLIFGDRITFKKEENEQKFRIELCIKY